MIREVNKLVQEQSLNLNPDPDSNAASQYSHLVWTGFFLRWSFYLGDHVLSLFVLCQSISHLFQFLI